MNNSFNQKNSKIFFQNKLSILKHFTCFKFFFYNFISLTQEIATDLTQDDLTPNLRN